MSDIKTFLLAWTFST